VSWTRDLMWAYHSKLEQEKELREYITKLGGTWPITETEEERRMSSELTAAMEKNGIKNFMYSRGHGSGLQVPGFTMLNGDPATPGDSPANGASPASTGPGPSRDRPGPTPLSRVNSNQTYWTNGGSDEQMMFKEEDEFGMDI